MIPVFRKDVAMLYRYNEIKTVFNEIHDDYVAHLDGYNYFCLNTSDDEYVYNIEDSFIIYICLKPNINMHNYIERSRGLRIEEPELVQLYHIIFEELTYNEIVPFKPSAFLKKHNYYFYDFLIYKSFNGIIDYINPYGNSHRNSNFSYVNKEYPSLNLLSRYNNWSGFLINYIVYELRKGDQVGHAVCYTSDIMTSRYAHKKVKDLEFCGLQEYHNLTKNGRIRDGICSYNGVKANKAMIDILVTEIQNHKDDGWANVKKNITGSSYLAGQLSFYVVPIYIKEKNKIWEIEQKVLHQSENSFFKEYTRIPYDISDYKWKSEEQCLKCVKDIFGDKKVIHQYRPYFLRTESGQMSYDIYISSKKIAIEYQGKQHFEPIELFGGVETFKLQKKRDQIKKEISERQGICLIFVNYWENITVELIRSKIQECQK